MAFVESQDTLRITLSYGAFFLASLHRYSCVRARFVLQPAPAESISMVCVASINATPHCDPRFESTHEICTRSSWDPNTPPEYFSTSKVQGPMRRILNVTVKNGISRSAA